MHIHLVANRIGLNGKVYDTSYVSNRASRVAEHISQDMGLTIARQVSRKRELRNEHTDPERQKIKDRIALVAYNELSRQHPDTRAFFLSLERFGIKTELPTNKKGNIFGIRFTMGGHTFKGSDIGKEFGLRTLSASFCQRVEGNRFTPPQQKQQHNHSPSFSPGKLYIPTSGHPGTHGELPDDEMKRKRKKKRGLGL